MQSKPQFKDPVGKLKGVLIVSCQADPQEPLFAPEHIAALSLSAINGGAGALRLEGADNVRVVRQALSSRGSDVPIIALIKTQGLTYDQRLDQAYITPSIDQARRLSDEGADIIAIDGTGRSRQDGLSLQEAIETIHEELGKPVMADIATCEQGIAADAFGADLISTTLFGYTRETSLPQEAGPGFDLLAQLAASSIMAPILMEGRIWHPDELKKAFELGAYAVVVGSAITRPHHITRRFVEAIPAGAIGEQAGIAAT